MMTRLALLLMMVGFGSLLGGCGETSDSTSPSLSTTAPTHSDTDHAAAPVTGSPVASSTVTRESSLPAKDVESVPASAGTEIAAPEKSTSSTFAFGKVTLAEGKPLTGEIVDIAISISGVSETGERVSYSPAVKADGSYRQRLVPGEYLFQPASITVQYKNAQFRMPLEPVGRLWNKHRDAAEGIEQDFVWKVVGPTPYGLSEAQPDPLNATHWYGMSVGLRPDGYRNDIKAATEKVADGTKFTFTFKPLGNGIDGRELKPVTAERTQQPTVLSSSNFDVPDLVPGPYELTGVATRPDGSESPLLFQGAGDYPNYKPAIRIDAEKDNILGTIAKPPLSFVFE